MRDPETGGTCPHHNDLNAAVAALKNQVANDAGRLIAVETKQEKLEVVVAAVCTEMKVAAATVKATAASTTRVARLWVPIIVACVTLLGTVANALLSHQAVVSAMSTAAGAKQ